jgi:uncharacterized protein YbgA (DUF1722 family)
MENVVVERLMAHLMKSYRDLGRDVANIKNFPRKNQNKYVEEFMAALAKVTTPEFNTNVLQHCTGYFK